MTIVRLTAYLGLAGAAAAFRAGADEVNYWPAYVVRTDPPAQTQSWSAAGPFLFSLPRPVPDPGHASGFRPFYQELDDSESKKTDILYPLYFHRTYPGAYKWSILNLINGEGLDAQDAPRPAAPIDKHFDIWPFYFSHETGTRSTPTTRSPDLRVMKYRLWL
jgi:hypothetical protein